MSGAGALSAARRRFFRRIGRGRSGSGRGLAGPLAPRLLGGSRRVAWTPMSFSVGAIRGTDGARGIIDHRLARRMLINEVRKGRSPHLPLYHWLISPGCPLLKVGRVLRVAKDAAMDSTRFVLRDLKERFIMGS